MITNMTGSRWPSKAKGVAADRVQPEKNTRTLVWYLAVVVCVLALFLSRESAFKDVAILSLPLFALSAFFALFAERSEAKTPPFPTLPFISIGLFTVYIALLAVFEPLADQVLTVQSALTLIVGIPAALYVIYKCRIATFLINGFNWIVLLLTISYLITLVLSMGLHVSLNSLKIMAIDQGYGEIKCTVFFPFTPAYGGAAYRGTFIRNSFLFRESGIAQAFIAALLVYRLATPKKNYFNLFLIFIGLLTTVSTAGIVSLGVACTMLGFFNKRTWVKLLSPIVAGAALYAFLFLPIIGFVDKSSGGHSVSERLVFQASYEVLRAEPLGAGINGVPTVDGRRYNFGNFTAKSQAKNDLSGISLLGVAWQLGVPGFLFLLSYYLFLFWIPGYGFRCAATLSPLLATILVAQPIGYLLGTCVFALVVYCATWEAIVSPKKVEKKRLSGLKKRRKAQLQRSFVR